MQLGTIDFGSTTYTISSERTESNCHFGSCDFRNNAIVVDDTLSPENFVKTLIHEVVHAMLFEYGLFQTDDEMNESITRQLSKPLYDFFYYNPMFGVTINEFLRDSQDGSPEPSTKKGARKSGRKSKGNGDRSDTDNNLPPSNKPRKNRSKKNSKGT